MKLITTTVTVPIDSNLAALHVGPNLRDRDVEPGTDVLSCPPVRHVGAGSAPARIVPLGA